MCLYTLDSDPKIAEEDIICYKVLEFNIANESFITPYTGKYVDNKILEGEKNFVAEGFEDVRKASLCGFGISGYDVGGGYIHTFINKEDALNEAMRLSDFGKDFRYCVFRCVIPKDIQYYVGYFDLCSKEIKFIEQISTSVCQCQIL